MMNPEQTSQNIFKYNFILCQNMLHNLMFQAKEICVPFKNTSSEKDKVKVKNRVGYTASCLHSECYESKSHKCVYCSEN